MKSALRLRRPADFARVKRLGAAFRHPDLLIRVRENETHNRYGIVISRRHGNAVARNRFKRRARAILTDLHASLNQGFDVVVLARPGSVEQPFGDLQRTLKRLLVRAGLVGTG